jgi:hypothetical protein
MLKGYLMSALIVLVFLALCYLLIYRFAPAPNEPTSLISQALKKEINEYYGKETVTDVTMESVGYGFEGLGNDEGSTPAPTYLITAKTIIDGQEGCVYALAEDLTPIGIHLVANDLIQKIRMMKHGLRIIC